MSNWKKQIKLQYPEYTKLMTVSDEGLLHPEIDMTNCVDLFFACDEHGSSVLLSIQKEELLYRDRYQLCYLGVFNQDALTSFEWFVAGEID